MQFTSSRAYTVGAEWELQLLDADTLDLKPAISTLLGLFADNEYVKAEFFQSCVELNSPIAENSNELRHHFQTLAASVWNRCADHGIKIAGAGTHAFCRRLALITPQPRYSKLADEYGYVAQTQIAFATHVHIGIPSGDEAIRVMRYMTPALPLLVAVCANSPFWRGHETGFASYRRRLLAVARSYGIPPYFENWQSFQTFFTMAHRAGSLHSIKDIHWDIRPHPDFGTLEFRVMDAQATAAEVAFIAGLIRILVAWVNSSTSEVIEAVLPNRLSPWIDRDNHFRATHRGLEAHLIDTSTGETRALHSYLCALCDACAGVAAAIGESSVIDRLVAFVGSDPPYRKQQNVYSSSDSGQAVVADLAARFESSLDLPCSYGPL